MFRHLRGRPTHATVVAYLALFVALGGTSVAAVTLKRNSVTGKNIARNAVTGPKVKDRTLLATDFKQGQLPQGPAGTQGAKGDPCSAADPACRGPQGERGVQGPGAMKIAWTTAVFDHNKHLGSVGPWSIDVDCDMQGTAALYLSISGPGSADYYVVRSEGNPGVDDVYARSTPLGDIADFSGQSPADGFLRTAGTLMLHSGDTVAEVKLNMLADTPTNPNLRRCSIYGTITPTS